jgi:hypothetical protein
MSDFAFSLEITKYKESLFFFIIKDNQMDLN